MTLTSTQISIIKAIIGDTHCLRAGDELARYAHDHTEDLVFLPDMVVLPDTPQQISELLRYCTQEHLPVTVRGAGTGLAGGALPVRGGIVLSMERFNRILQIDERNLQVTTEPGVITEVLQNAVREKGLFYPPDPASRGWCFIGGNISTNAGGPKAVKYGVVRDYVLNLEVVLPTGDIIWTGANTLKNSTGYNLTHLIVGSEGTLGVVTKIVLKLLPYPTYNLLMLAPFKDATQACAAVSAIFRAGVLPSGLELMERDAIEWAIRYVGEAPLALAEDDAAHLLIEVDGQHLESLHEDCATIVSVLEQFECGDILFADSEAQKNELWRLRRNVAQAVKTTSVYKEEDTVVPRAELPALLKGVKEIGARYGFQSVCYGHAGDGNLHVNIIKGDLSEEVWQTELPKAIREIFTLVKSLGGTLSGEHGIGYVQRPYMDIMFEEATFALFRGIKKTFDPAGILNPDKIFYQSVAVA